MHKIIFILLPILLPLTMLGQEQLQSAAKAGLSKFRQLSQTVPGGEHGLAGSDTSILRLGQPVQTAIVPLNKLKDYKGQAPSTVIADVDEFVYPVVKSTNSNVAGNITVSKAAGRWKAVRFNAEAEMLMDTAAGLLSKPTRTYRLIKILVFHASFLSYSENGNLMFIPLQDDKARELFKGVPVKAEAAISKYVTAASRYNGLPN
jgi:hypothetical protein